MRAPTRIQVKLFASPAADVPSRAVIPVFHRWIQTHAIDELLIDVTDYGHVPRGPGVLLIGHESDYGYDLGEGRAGLLYTRKRGGSDDLGERIHDATRRALRAAHLLESDGSLAPLRFDTRELLFRFPDRLHAPNDAATLEALRASLGSTCDRIWSGAAHTLSREGDPRAPLTVVARTETAMALDALVRRATG